MESEVSTDSVDQYVWSNGNNCLCDLQRDWGTGDYGEYQQYWSTVADFACLCPRCQSTVGSQGSEGRAVYCRSWCRSWIFESRRADSGAISPRSICGRRVDVP